MKIGNKGKMKKWIIALMLNIGLISSAAHARGSKPPEADSESTRAVVSLNANVLNSMIQDVSAANYEILGVSDCVISLSRMGEANKKIKFIGPGLASCYLGEEWSDPSYVYLNLKSLEREIDLKKIDSVVLLLSGKDAAAQLSAGILRLNNYVNVITGVPQTGKEDLLNGEFNIVSFVRYGGRIQKVSLLGSEIIHLEDWNAEAYSKVNRSPSAHDLLNARGQRPLFLEEFMKIFEEQ